MSDTVVAVGQLRVRLHGDPPTAASIECGYTICDVGYTAGYRFASELTAIREALIAAHAVIVDRGLHGGTTTSAEMTLAAKLVDLGIMSTKETP